ncbi:DNA polymerase Y family protein [Rhodopirellula sp. JC740]|uniref:DNA polymerase Y family protein n=1 Tax=Rhodopirellula halodulae TaxID=2894198 RepID=A0ABS8NGK2_9BACT|nr:DNA polymerase Y family protein [Rhodopirellula sp. JC740]MCC9642666.1 DNA polymerase Y family protein [Rhodopirellula sp. JC740]
MPIAQAVDLTSSQATSPDQQKHHVEKPTSNHASDTTNARTATAEHATIDEHNRVADRRALHSLATELQHHLCPQIATETLDRFKWSGRFRHDPEALVAEIQSVTHLFGNETDLLAAAASILQRRGLRARLAIASTLGAAWALANHAPSHSRKPGVSDQNAPSFDFFVAPPERTHEALQTLPPSALRLNPTDVETLHRLGIDTVGSLLRLPRNGLATRIGHGLCQRIAQALGEIDEPILAIDLPTEHAAELELEYPTDAVDLLRDRIIRLIDSATQNLRPLNRGVLRLRCQVEFTESPPVTLESGLFSPTLDLNHLSNLMIGAFESHHIASKVSHLRIGVLQDAPLASTQPSIFGPGFENDAQTDWTRQTDVARLIDSLSGRLGEDAVRGVRINRDPLPENAVTEFPLTQSRGRKLATARPKRNRSKPRSGNQPPDSPLPRTGHRAGVPTATDAGRRPLQLHTSPQRITPLSHGKEPVPENQFPPRFRFRGRVWDVRQHWGPERIETRWWQGPMIRRDYFRVEFQDGTRWWIFRDLNQPADWQLHGWFD